jgi:hypothetical protein
MCWKSRFAKSTYDSSSSNNVSDQEDQSDGGRESEDHFGPNNHWQGEFEQNCTMIFATEKKC